MSSFSYLYIHWCLHLQLWMLPCNYSWPPTSVVKMMYVGTGKDTSKKMVKANLNPMMERLINQENNSLI